MKVSAIATPSGEYADLIPIEARGTPEPAVGRIDRGQGNAGHRRRQSEREIHQRVEQAFAGKAVAHQHPRHQDAEYQIDQSADQRRSKGQAIGSHRARRSSNVPELVPAERRRFQKSSSQRNQDNQAEIQHGVTQRQSESRQVAAFFESESHSAYQLG